MHVPNYNAMSTDELLTLLQHNERPEVQALVERLDALQEERDEIFVEVHELTGAMPQDMEDLQQTIVDLSRGYDEAESELQPLKNTMEFYGVADADDLDARLAMAEKWAHIELTTDLQDEYQVERFYREHADT